MFFTLTQFTLKKSQLNSFLLSPIVAVENFYQTIKQLKAHQPFAKKWCHFCENLETLEKQRSRHTRRYKTTTWKIRTFFFVRQIEALEKCRVSAVKMKERCVKSLPLSPPGDYTVYPALHTNPHSFASAMLRCCHDHYTPLSKPLLTLH